MLVGLVLWGIVLTSLLIIVALSHFIILPFIRQEMRRHAARRHTPQPEEIWIQDGEILYIDATSPTGVEIIHFDGKTMNRWKDTWVEWQQRLKVRNIYWTGQRRPLGRG
jgi:hypothetical protein